MKITIIGTGYVGLPTGVGFAELGNSVWCVDQDPNKIETLNNGTVTIYEEGLEELFSKNLKSGNIKFTTSMKEGLADTDLIMIAVGTPPHPETQEADMKYIYAAAAEIAEHLSDRYVVIATKSTVPVGTGDEVESIIKSKNPMANFDIVSLPEFLREGFAVFDFFNPDRIVVGSNNEKASNLINKLYLPFDGKTKMHFVSRRSSETIKYASNAFLAMKVHYINEMANFCEKSGANIFEVAEGMGLDSRIGNKFLNPGPGYGGSCFPKDTLAMAHMGRKFDVDLNLIESTIKGNSDRQKQMAKRILNTIKDVKDPTVAVLGLSFKSGTDDCRESPAISIVQELLFLAPSLKIKAFDPKGIPMAKTLLGNKVEYATDSYDALKGADLMAILTEWPEFKSLNLDEAKSCMRKNCIIDLRGMICTDKARDYGFTYYGIGK